MTRGDLADDEESLRTAISDYLRRWWTARATRPGDRVVEVTGAMSTHLPFLNRQRPDLHSLTILSSVPPRTSGTDTVSPFPVTRRHVDIAQAWPVAGPFDLVIHTEPTADRSPDAWWAGVAQAVAVLTVGGRIVLAVPEGIDARPDALHAAGLAVNEIRGVTPPADPAEVEAIVTTRFGRDAADLYGTMRRGNPGALVDAVVATTLVGDAVEVLHVCRKFPPAPRTGR